MIEKILLIQPPYTILKHEPKGSQPPLGLAYIAAVLESENYRVKILDAVAEGFEIEYRHEDLITYGLKEEEIAENIRDFAPDLIGVSCLFSTQAKSAHNICKIAKTANRQITTVMGGAHPSALPAETISDPNIDFVLIGEADRSLAELIGRLNGNSAFEEMDGIAFGEEGKITVNRKTQFIADLDSLPLPARHLLPMEKYFSINRPHGTVSVRSPNTSLITSRGCPAKCTFCSIHSIWGRKFRGRSPENVIAEIESLIEDYGIKELQFEDDNLTFDRQRARSLFQGMIEKKIDILWTTPNGIATYSLDSGLLELMRKSGCYRICLAIESGNERVLHKIIHKPLKLSTVKPLINKSRELGIAVDAFFVLGFPGETKEEMADTFKFANEIGAENINFFAATPYPGTELYETCKRDGLLPKELSFEKLRVGHAVICTSEFSPEDLEKKIASEYIKFRMRQLKHPSVFYRRVIKRLLIDPRFFLSYGRKLIKKLFKS